MHEKDLRYTLYIAATPEKVWRALTENGSVAQCWFGRTIRSDWLPGAAITIHAPDGRVDVSGVILEWEPERKLGYTFNIEGYPESEAHFELKPFGAVTRLTLTHLNHSPEPLPPEAPEIQQRGWMIILNGLKTLVETGKPLPEGPGAFV